MTTAADSVRSIRKDLTGQRFERLTVNIATRKNGKNYWQCICDCGKTVDVYGSKLLSGATKSCGCYGREALKASRTTHGMSGTKTHRIWWRMVTRVRNPNDADFARYSKLGIDSSWLKFENFLRDMGEVGDKLSIERKDNNLGYFPENCYWATTKQQTRNKSNTLFVTHLGETKPLIEWCEITAIPWFRAYQRYKAKMEPALIFYPGRLHKNKVPNAR